MTLRSSQFESTPKQTAEVRQHLPVYMELAETEVNDPDFRSADAKPFEGLYVSFEDIDAHNASKRAAREVMFDAISYDRHASESEKAWEMTRVAALRHLSGTALGSFADYFTNLHGETSSDGKTIGDLPAGELAVIKTNERVLSAKRYYDDPLEFMDMSLGAILRRKEQDRFSIGPENYSTAIKFFADKYQELENPLEEVSPTDIRELMTDALQGLVDVAKRDAPNVVELTNIFYAIRTLPKSSIEGRFTKPLLRYSLNVLHDFSPKTISVFLGAMPKLELSEDGESAAQLVDLSLRKSKTFETTNDLRVALRAIEVLPKSTATENAFESFLQYRNGIEHSLDLDGSDEVVYRLRQISEKVLTAPENIVNSKAMAEVIARRSSETAKRYFLEGGLTADQETQIKQTFARIMHNYKAI